jgi:hypothetical protein
MRYNGLIIFLVFFGVGLINAIAVGNWLSTAFWVAVGAAFTWMDWLGHRRATRR